MSDMSNNLLNKNRSEWRSRFGFLMAATGSAVGLGNLFRFPYLVGSYGGAVFVLLYLIFLVLIGVPLMLTEITIGQYGKTDPYGSYVKIHPRLGIFGLMGVVCGFTLLSYYATIGGWVTHYMFVYFVALFGGKGIPVGQAPEIFSTIISHPWLPVLWELVFIGTTVGIILSGLEKGTERSNKIMVPALFIILVTLSFVSISLNGSSAGLEFYLKPDFSKLSLSVAGEALGQVFFSLSLGMGAMITYGSYLGANQSAKRNSVLIPAFDTLAALLAGFVIFPAVFAVGMSPASGIGLLFIILPEVFNKLPAGNFIGFALFVSIFFAALSSAISMLEIVVAYFVDQKKMKRPNTLLIVGVIAGLLGVLPALANGNGILSQVTISSLVGNPTWMAKIPIFNLGAFDLLDYLTGRILLPLGGFALCITAGWIMGKDKLLSVITQDGKRPFVLGNVYFFIVKYVAPIAILIIFIQAITG